LALFTFVLEFNGGTFIEQHRSLSVTDALEKWATALEKNTVVANKRVRVQLAARIREDEPALLQVIQNVWCCTGSAGRKFALLNIIRTNEN